MSKEIQKELETITSYLTKLEKDKVIDALRLSQEAHSNQLRKSGDPFITHPLEVAKILTSIKLDADSIVAGLLHDTLEDTRLNIEEINKKFGNEIVELPSIIGNLFNLKHLTVWDNQLSSIPSTISSKLSKLPIL